MIEENDGRLQIDLWLALARLQGVYVWYRGASVLYVGATGNLLGRFGSHHVINRESVERGDVLRFYPVPDMTDMYFVESCLIEHYRPKFNRLARSGQYQIPGGVASKSALEVVRELIGSIPPRLEAHQYLERAHLESLAAARLKILENNT